MPATRADRHDLRPLLEALAVRFPEAAFEGPAGGGEVSVRAPAAALLDLLRALKDAGFVLLEDIAVFDNLPAPVASGLRFTVVYRLYDPAGPVRARVSTDVGEQGSLPSATAVFRAADWPEREAFDMFGVRFDGHPDLRRVYLPEDFEGHPLRKDFPLAGRTGGA